MRYFDMFQRHRVYNEIWSNKIDKTKGSNFYLFIYFFKIRFFCSFRAHPGISSCRPQTHRDLSSSSSQKLGLKNVSHHHLDKESKT